jgi:hypothetical protein
VSWALLIFYVQPFARKTHVTYHDTSEWLRHDARYRHALSAFCCRRRTVVRKTWGEPEWINVMILHLNFCSATLIPLSLSPALRGTIAKTRFSDCCCAVSPERVGLLEYQVQPCRKKAIGRVRRIHRVEKPITNSTCMFDSAPRPSETCVSKAMSVSSKGILMSMTVALRALWKVCDRYRRFRNVARSN